MEATTAALAAVLPDSAARADAETGAGAAGVAAPATMPLWCWPRELGPCPGCLLAAGLRVVQCEPGMPFTLSTFRSLGQWGPIAWFARAA